MIDFRLPNGIRKALKSSAKYRGWLIMTGCVIVSVTALGRIISGAGVSRIEQLIRPEANEGNKSYELTVVREDGEQASVEIALGPRRYSEKEADAVFQKAMEILPDRILGNNSSLEQISSDMELPDSLEELGIQMTWKSSAPEIIDAAGHLAEGRTQEGIEEAVLTVTMMFQRYQRTEEIRIEVLPPGPMPWEDRLRQELERRAEASSGDRVLALPEEFEGEGIAFVRKEDISRKMGLALLPAAAGAALFMGNGQKEDRKKKKRQEEISADYPELVVKMTVLYQAGMSMRGVWERISADERRKGGKLRPIYEEVSFACNSMADGVPETEAYRQFGRRCCTSGCLKLGNLLAGNVRRGTKQLSAMMAEESARAWDERKHRARRSGEKAGTKMLLPMFMMFGVVLAIVVIPAFYGFM